MIEWQPWFEGEPSGPVLFADQLFPTPRTATPKNVNFSPRPAHRESLSPLHRASIAATRQHARRLATYAGAVGRHIGLSEKDLGILRVGSLLHDVGKNALPPHVLYKCGRLTAEEFATVKFHPIIGDLLCARVPALHSVRPIVRHHHERLDGSGYPDGLFGNDIPFLAQIVGIVDVYDALVTNRPYKPAYDHAHAVDILHREVELGWRRADLVAAFIDAIESGEAGELALVAASA